ncbi:MAG TPA: T9SS type A sorting domain-containing protein [Puia sp.]|nr:T9SS type A sorting domain-containing protein [Puia sp.]
MRIIVFLLFLISSERLAAATTPVLGTTTFNNNFSATANLLASTPSPGSALNVGTSIPSGWDFTVTVPGANVSISASAAGANPGGASDFCIRMNSLTGGVSVQTTGAKSNDGSAFQLQSVYLKLNIVAGAPANMTMTGYRSGVAVSGATLTVNSIATATWTQFDVSAKTAFANVDEFRFTQASGSSAVISFEAVDQITIAAPINLPLTLLDFSGQRTDNKVNLQWTTTQEDNTAGFEVQRDDNGAGFSTVGLVQAAGNSTQIIHYNYTDALPAVSSPAYFYRLKMSDLDGHSTYSPVLKISTPSSGLSFSAYPNPFREQIAITMEAPEADKARLTIRGINGQQLLGQDLSIQKGTNSFPLPAIVHLPAGLYLLNIATSHQQQTIRVLKIE